MTPSRWISLKDLAEETGVSVRTLQYIAQREPAVLTTRASKSKLEYAQPHCAVSLRLREREAGVREERKRWMEREGGGRTGDPIRRKMEADARKAEIEVELLEKSSVPVAAAIELFEQTLTNARAMLMPFARVVAPKLIACVSIQEMEYELDREIRRVMEQMASPALVPTLVSPGDGTEHPTSAPDRTDAPPPKKRKRRVSDA